MDNYKIYFVINKIGFPKSVKDLETRSSVTNKNHIACQTIWLLSG